MAPKKKVAGLIKLQIQAGQANPAPPVGPALGQHGVNIMEFCKAYNAATENQRGNVIPVEITVYEDRSFTFALKTPPAAKLLLKAAGVPKGSAEPHKNKVKANLEHRIESMGQRQRFRRVVVPTEQVIETKDGQKVQAEKRVLPGYVLVNMDLNDDAWTVVKNTPGVTGFVGAGATPVPLSQPEVDRILHTGTGTAALARNQVEFQLGESVKITSGPLADFDGEITDVNPDAQKLQVMVNIFERQVPVEVGFDNVKKLD